MILGIDEVGRGPWAGPLVVGAVVLGDAEIDGLNDSKKLTAKKRALLDVQIREKAAGYGLGWVAADEIDQIGLSQALRLATMRAVEQIKVPYHEIIIDGTINFLADTNKGRYVTTLAKGDALIPSISAASIIAKVARDTFMAEQDSKYPGYGFAGHVGYGTAKHRQAIAELGVTPLHRLSFAPLRQYKTHQLSTKELGDQAEAMVEDYLKSQGHSIVSRNWKTRYVEIDIVSHHRGVIYFTEVKYRRSVAQGGGLAAITTQKLSQMTKAAEWYMHAYKLETNEAKLAVATVIGLPMRIERWLPLI